MPPVPDRKRWVRRHPVLTGVWLVIATIWLLAAIASYDDDLLVTVLAYLLIMAPITLAIYGLGRLSDWIGAWLTARRAQRETGRLDGMATRLPSRPVAPVAPVTGIDGSFQRLAFDRETARQRQMALDLKEREEALREREDLLLAEPLPPLPELKPPVVPPVVPLDRPSPAAAPARYCFNCGAWFGSPDDDTCRICRSPRVGAET